MKWLLPVVLLVSVPVRSQIQPGDFEYQGAFAIDGEFDPQVEQWYAYGQRGLSYDPSFDSLWVTGHDHATTIVEIGIPPLVISREWSELPVAPVLTPAFDFAECLDSSFHMSGVEVHRDRIWVSCKHWYNTAGRDLATMYHRDAETLGDLQGPFRAGRRSGKFHGSRQGAYLFSIPPDWAREHLNRPLTLATGFARGAGAFGGSQGPTIIAFHPRKPQKAKALVFYREFFPECLEDERECDFPGYRACDSWDGAAWVRSAAGDSVLISGVKAEGSNQYHPGGRDCSPYFGEILFYDARDLAASARRRVHPWEVVPYVRWRPREMWKSDHSFGGMAFDSRGGRLFVVEKSAGRNGRSIVHVWQTAPELTSE